VEFLDNFDKPKGIETIEKHTKSESDIFEMP
jgi:hypothetical protein